eukprot:TRINITY_DN5776_c0_g1_i1.p1 TRINITY_DN5776_c0_g1~~TRINITY_DN5776_c0_g1_i1.p1  ORF type:complete len:287 (-),score=57.49 TRINITY_DN5776_c0_g1_i1:340-1200(-)
MWKGTSCFSIRSIHRQTNKNKRCFVGQKIVVTQRSYKNRNELQTSYVNNLVKNIGSPLVGLETFKNKGVGLVAQDHIQEGQVVFSEDPYFVQPVLDQEGCMCSYCLKRSFSFRDLLNGTELINKDGVEDIIEKVDKEIGYKPLIHDSKTGKYFCDEVCQEKAWNEYDNAIFGENKEFPDISKYDQDLKSMKNFIYTLQAKLITEIRNGKKGEEALEPVLNLMAFPFESLPNIPKMDFVQEISQNVKDLLIKESDPQELLDYFFQFQLYCKVNLNYLEGIFIYFLIF